MITLVLLCFVATGCTGSFNLTKKVYNFHRSQDDKWKDEIFFLGAVLIPIYGICTFADAIVFNSIEFWTGKNPVEMSKVSGDTKSGKMDATLSFNRDNGQVIVQSKANSGQEATLVLERKDGVILAKNEQGQMLYSSMANDKGGINVYDQNLQLVKSYSSDDVNALKERLSK